MIRRFVQARCAREYRTRTRVKNVKEVNKVNDDKVERIHGRPVHVLGSLWASVRKELDGGSCPTVVRRHEAGVVDYGSRL